MKLSIIDIGTSSIKHSIFEKSAVGKQLIHYKRYSEANLGESDPISDETVDRCVAILHQCLVLNDSEGVAGLRLLGTEILRSASNAPEVAARLREACGQEIEIISQDKEALYLYEGFIGIVEPDSDFAAINIGGGSTELVIGGNGLTGFFKIPFGVKRIMKLFGNHDDIDWTALDEYLETEISFDYTSPRLFTTGVLPFMQAIRSTVPFETENSTIPEHPFSLSMVEYRAWIERMRSMPIAELKRAYAKDPSYCDGVTIGQSVYYACAKKLGAQLIIPSARDLSDGVLYEMAQ